MKVVSCIAVSVVLLSVPALSASDQNAVSAAKDTASKPATAQTAAPVVQSVDTTATKTAQERIFTIEELATYNGQNGQPAYVAIDGVVYDETGVGAWKNGKHKGGTAGTDITALIKKSPHGKSVLKKRTVVGKLAPVPAPVKTN